MWLLPEQYERGDTTMTQYALAPEYGEGAFRFTLLTPNPDLPPLILDNFCVRSTAFIVRSDRLLQFNMLVVGPFAWEMLTALLDEHLMSDVWGTAIDEVVGKWNVGTADIQ